MNDRNQMLRTALHYDLEIQLIDRDRQSNDRLVETYTYSRDGMVLTMIYRNGKMARGKMASPQADINYVPGHFHKVADDVEYALEA